MLLDRLLTKIAAIYRGSNYYERYERMYSANLRRVPSFQLIEQFSKGRTLDLGCGIGYLSRLFTEYVGMDTQADALRIARKHSDAPFLMGTISKIPFRSNSFDTIILYDVIEHIEDLNEILRELKKIAGRLVISFADFQSYYRWFVYDPTHKSRDTIQSIIPVLKASFKHVTIHKTSGIFSLPTSLNLFVSRHFPNQLVIECHD